MLKDIAAEAHSCYSEEFKSYWGRVFNMKRLKSSGKTALSEVLIFSYLENLFHFHESMPRKWPDTFSSHFQTTESLSWGNRIFPTPVMWIFTSQVWSWYQWHGNNTLGLSYKSPCFGPQLHIIVSHLMLIPVDINYKYFFLHCKMCNYPRVSKELKVYSCSPPMPPESYNIPL